jgi:DNA-binding NarL/FixJ family response regulator
MPACAGPKNSETVVGVINRLPAADVTAAVNRLMTVSEGDPVLLCALAFTALGLDESTRERRLNEVIRDRATVSCSASETVPRYLTQRQREVLELLSDGLTVQAIARRLSLSPRTVGKHLERVYRRLGTSDRLTTVIRAQRYGLLTGRVVAGVPSPKLDNPGSHI